MDGAYHLNARGVNYSGGGLKIVFSNVFRKKHFERYNIQSVLLLGLGGGDVVSILSEEYGKTPRIVGIEGDAAILELGEKYFHLSRFPHLEPVHSEAMEFLRNCQEKFDMVIIDLFVDNEVPKQFQTKEFAEMVQRVTNPRSLVIFNKMIYKKELKSEMIEIEQRFREVFPRVELVKTSSYGVENNMLWCDTFLD